MVEYLEREGFQDAISQIKDYMDAELQPVLVDGENIKTVNGNSLLGEGNLPVKTYQPFPSGWRTNSTMANLMADITADTNAVMGMAYLGEVTCSDLPFAGNAELIVNIMDDDPHKVIWCTLSSGNVSPYYWHYTYWGNQGSGWRSYIPSNLSSGTLTLGIGYDSNNNLVKGSIAPESLTSQEAQDMCDDILYPALPAPENVSAVGTVVSFDAVTNAEWYEFFADGDLIGNYEPYPIAADYSVDVSALTGWNNLSDGDHDITVGAGANDYPRVRQSEAVVVNKQSAPEE